jgi:hypothetical protein
VSYLIVDAAHGAKDLKPREASHILVLTLRKCCLGAAGSSGDDKLLQSELSVHVYCELGRVEVNQQLFELPLQAIAEHSGNNHSTQAAHESSKRKSSHF